MTVGVLIDPTSLHDSSAGDGASFCVLHVDPMEPTETAPLLDPTARNGNVMSVRLLQPRVRLEGWSSVRTGMGMESCHAWGWRKHVPKRSFGRKVAGEGFKDLYTGETKAEFAFPSLSFITDYVCEDSSDIPCCSSTFHPQEHFFRASNLEGNPDSSWTEWLQPSLLEKPESSGGRRSHSWRSKGIRIAKNCKKSK